MVNDLTGQLRLLSVVDDGDRVVVGDPRCGRFVAVAPVGGVVIRALQDGATQEEAAAAAARFAGQPVNVCGFLARLEQLGFLAVAGGPVAELGRTAAIQQRRWLAGPSQRRVAWLFGRAAWAAYVTTFAFDVAVLVVRPSIMPRPRDAYLLLSAGPGPSLLLLFPFTVALVAVHECWHWLAARAAGLAARFGVDHRMYFVVFETDLSLLWTLPRRRRFGPLLAGLAADSVILAVLLQVRLGAALGWWSQPALLGRLAAATAFAQLAAMAWQCLLFLRTDLYAVLVTAAGCHNLWRVKTLSLRRALGILTADQAAELATATARDRAVAAWFGWVWLTGFLAAAAWFFWFSLPLLTHLVAWIGPGLATAPGSARFWVTIGCTAVLAWRYGIPAVLTAVSARTAIRAARARRRESSREVTPG